MKSRGLVMICKKLDTIMEIINKIALVIKQQDLKIRVRSESGLKLLLLVLLTVMSIAAGAFCEDK